MNKHYEESREWQLIKGAATEMKIPICDPKDTCKKCNGRGWFAKQAKDGMPIFCECIFRESKDLISKVTLPSYNRVELRRARKSKVKTDAQAPPEAEILQRLNDRLTAQEV